jgi:serine/threonine protein phosphatase 1
VGSKRTIVVGDVHGCRKELASLLDSVGLDASNDMLVMAGDLVDKGYDSPGVVQDLRALREGGQPLVLVTGNHDEKHERWRAKVRAGKSTSKMTGTEEMEAINRSLSEADIAFMETSVLYHRLPEHGALVVHGGIPPAVDELPDLAALPGLTSRERDRARQLLRLRHVNPDGNMVSLGDERPGDRFWAEIYDGRFGHVFFGHQPWIGEEEPRKFTHATGLDLGCVFGNRLAAAVLVGSTVSYAMVPATGQYATALWDN